MADNEHLRILQQKRQQWNEWRQAYPKIRLDLSDADLSDADLIGVNLSDALQLHFFSRSLIL